MNQRCLICTVLILNQRCWIQRLFSIGVVGYSAVQRLIFPLESLLSDKAQILNPGLYPTSLIQSCRYGADSASALYNTDSK